MNAVHLPAEKEHLFLLRAPGMRYAKLAVEAAVYAIATVLMISPVATHLGDRIIGTGDGEFYMWLGWRMSELIQDGRLPTRIPDVIAPDGFNLLLADGYGAYLVIAFWNFFAGPFLAFNLTVLTALFANFAAGRRLGRIVAPGHPVIWTLTAVAFGTAPSIALRMYGHIHLCFAFISALIVVEGVLYLKEGKRLRPIRLGLLLFAAFLFSIYWLVTSLTALGIMVLVGSIRRRELRRSIVGLAIPVAIAAVGMTPFLVNRAMFDRDERGSASWNGNQELDNSRNSVFFSADLMSVVTQPSASKYPFPGAERMHRDFFPNRLESTIFPGLLLLIGFVGLATFAARGSPLRWPIIAAFVVLWLLSLGPTLQVDGDLISKHADGSPRRFMPEEALYHFPGTSALRTPNRLAFALPAVFAVGLAMTGAWVMTRLRRRWLMVAVGALAFAAVPLNLVTPMPYADFGLTAPTQTALSAIRTESNRHDTVLEVPFDPAGQYVQNIKFQILHRRPVLGFHAQHSSLGWYSGFEKYKKSRALAVLRCLPGQIAYSPTSFPGDVPAQGDELQALFRDFGVRYIIVNKEFLGSELCAPRRAVIQSVLDKATIRGADTRWTILENPSKNRGVRQSEIRE